MSCSLHLRVSAEISLTVKVTEVTFHSEWKEKERKEKKNKKIQKAEDGKKVKSNQNLVFLFGVHHLSVYTKQLHSHVD